MGMYTGFRFKGIVKKEFREQFEQIAMYGKWSEAQDPVFKKFGDDNSRAAFFPCGSIEWMPEEWGGYIRDRNQGIEKWTWMEPKEYLRSFDEVSGLWVFQCSLKNYDEEIDTFMEMVPYFVENIIFCLSHYEEEEDYDTQYFLNSDGNVSSEHVACDWNNDLEYIEMVPE